MPTPRWLTADRRLLPRHIGSTVCLGKRLATLELKLITALFVLGTRELRAVDAAGAPLAELPRPNWNDILTCRPAKGSVFMRFERTAESSGTPGPNGEP